MNPDKFIVRMHLEAVERYQDRQVWDQLGPESETLLNEVAGLPSEQETDDIESRMFDLTALRMQLALIEVDASGFDRLRRRVMYIAALLEEKITIPMVIGYLPLLANLLEQRQAPSLAHFIRRLVGMDCEAAQEAFSDFLSDRSLTSSQVRFIETIIDQLTSRGVMDAKALYEPSFSHLHGGGPDELFAGKENVIDGIFGALEATQPKVITQAG